MSQLKKSSKKYWTLKQYPYTNWQANPILKNQGGSS